MNRLSNFKEFYLKVVLPNTPSYKNWLNEENFDKNINELIQKYQMSYGFNPFEDNVSLDELDKEPENSTFQEYSMSKLSGVPRAIINTHYRKFLEYRDDIYFENLQELIDEPTLKSKACLKCLYFTIIIFDLCRYLEYFSYLCTINQTE